ncbi:hypothetical protein OUZ56_019858 [Daphnia magna]|uniref:Uncharacterized protein n=1 Tax=Daphnia magna TaxID=35525 RepID=A0ABQ9ZCU3_9CRUS|nr:hypothetical protein OUZ56_019858 [Daphnia magna]
MYCDCRERALSAAFFKASLLSFQVEANHFRTSCTYPPPPVVVEDSLSLIFYSCWIDCDDNSPAQQHPTYKYRRRLEAEERIHNAIITHQLQLAVVPRPSMLETSFVNTCGWQL